MTTGTNGTSPVAGASQRAVRAGARRLRGRSTVITGGAGFVGTNLADRLLAEGRRVLVFEDGRQRRDFVCVGDVARAAALALERPGADGQVLNVGSGRSVSVLEIYDELRLVLEAEVEPRVSAMARTGDIRHCFADIGLARELLGFAPQVGLEDGLRELAGWLEGQVAEDRVDLAAHELATRGLTR